MVYIQRCVGKNLETVDEFTSYSEAKLNIVEYRISDKTAIYYLSNRACKAWNQSKG
jgi:hypothetical protein